MVASPSRPRLPRGFKHMGSVRVPALRADEHILIDCCMITGVYLFEESVCTFMPEPSPRVLATVSEWYPGVFGSSPDIHPLSALSPSHIIPTAEGE